MDLGPVDFPTLGHQCATWIETFLRHGPGDISGEAIELDDEFYAFICHCYRVFPQDVIPTGDEPVVEDEDEDEDDRLMTAARAAGRRTYRRAILSRPKGRAKSELAGMLVCVEALGPARFDHWAVAGETSWWGYEYDEGEPVGVPVQDPFIRCLATEASQSANTYENVRVMLSGQEVDDAYPGIDVGLTRIFLPNDGGEIRPSTASGASKDGGKETFAVSDETHLYELKELRDMHKVVRRNLRKRKEAEPWMLETTTAYRPGMDSIAERAATLSQELASLEAHIDRGLLYDHREAPAVENVRNPKETIPALRKVYGPAAAWMDLASIAQEMADPTEEEEDQRRYWLNQVTRGANAWLSSGDLSRMFDEEVGLVPGEPLCLGFDGSRYHDATALIACTHDWRWVPLGIWENDGSPDWEVPEDEVDAAVEFAHSEFRVLRALADPPYWETEIARWAGKWPRAWKRFPTQAQGRMSGAVAATTSSIRAGRVKAQAGGVFSDAFRDQLANAQKQHMIGPSAVSAQKAGNATPFVLTKDQKGSPRKIDAAPAAVLAHEAARDAHTEGLWRKAMRPKKKRRMVALSD
jgi:hypothetical protein